ncbi:MAG: TIGR04222 domain-containing membrane protein [Betaproteobacteria bacterium]|nr:TIGR04222 domain-containing membrane protein [Betaproteobacteria bacterium]
MNPFMLTGFSFLAFYLVVGILVAWGLRRWIISSESNGAPAQNLTDPYLIAYLRAGENEAMRVATVALLDRGLLEANGEQIKTKSSASVEMVKRPIEKAILRKFLAAGEAHELFKDAGAKAACDSYRQALLKDGLIADASTYAKRALPALMAIGLMGAITWTKISIAFSQGRHNVGFLVFLTIIFAIVLIYIWKRRLTGRGNAMLADLKDLFSRLKGRAKTLRAGGQTNEAAMLAAVFGLSALPAAHFPFMEKLYPARSSDGSGCGSSSSSCSSGSSCSGGCGGGGCGG